MLKQRVITASLMMLTFLLILFYAPWQGFVAFAAVVFLMASWEWSGLSAITAPIARLAYVVFIGLAAWFLAEWSDWGQDVKNVRAAVLAGCLWWSLAFLWVQGFPASRLLWQARPIRLAMGACILLPSWLAVVYLRNQSEGAMVVLLCLLLVAAMDVGAFFSGRRFGRRKLAPRVSPGKSWEGVWGGLALAAVVGLSYGSLLYGGDWLVMLIMIIPTALVSVLGDLVESMVKRVRGCKDSSSLLPGHGGVLDRIDGLVSALPVFTLTMIVTQSHL